MPDLPLDAAGYVRAASAAIGLAIPPECRAGVERYFELAAEFAALVTTLPLAPHDEPACVFTPVEPDPRAPR